MGLFLGVVLLCGVFFTLGYVMGKTQDGGAVHAAEAVVAKAVPSARIPDPSSDQNSNSSPTPGDTPSASAPAANEWDFYNQKNADHLAPAARTASPTPAVAHPENGGSGTNPATVPAAAHLQAPPRMVKGSIVLQIAALTRQGDALAMADELQQKKFPAFVVAPSTDSFYRVQVGPYSDERAADTAKAALDHAGFKAITKR